MWITAGSNIRAQVTAIALEASGQTPLKSSSFMFSPAVQSAPIFLLDDGPRVSSQISFKAGLCVIDAETKPPSRIVTDQCPGFESVLGFVQVWLFRGVSGTAEPAALRTPEKELQWECLIFPGR